MTIERDGPTPVQRKHNKTEKEVQRLTFAVRVIDDLFWCIVSSTRQQGRHNAMHSSIIGLGQKLPKKASLQAAFAAPGEDFSRISWKKSCAGDKRLDHSKVLMPTCVHMDFTLSM